MMLTPISQPNVYSKQMPTGEIIWRYSGNEYAAECHEFRRVFYQPEQKAFTVDVAGQQAWIPVAGLSRMSLVRLVRLAEYLHGETPAIHPRDLMRYFEPKLSIFSGQGQYKVRDKTDWMLLDALVDWLISELEDKGDRPDDPYFEMLHSMGIKVQTRYGQAKATYLLIEQNRPITPWLDRDRIIEFAIQRWTAIELLHVYLKRSNGAKAVFWQSLSIVMDHVGVDRSITDAVYQIGDRNA